MSRFLPNRSIPSLRRILLRLHRDLLSVHGLVRPYLLHYPTRLTELERLVLVLEDRRFFRHSGIDYIALLREVTRLLMLRKHGGASTIDMQLVRTATGYRAPTVKRKLYEMFLARIIQYRYSKLLILRSYLASAYLGWNLRGTEDAAQALFGKFSDELDVDEAAALASMLVFPRPRQISSGWQTKISRRANYIKAVYVRRKKRFEKLERRVFR